MESAPSIGCPAWVLEVNTLGLSRSQEAVSIRNGNWMGTKLAKGQGCLPVLGNGFWKLETLTRGTYFVTVAEVSKHLWPS
jgi:hypothetical protein